MKQNLFIMLSIIGMIFMISLSTLVSSSPVGGSVEKSTPSNQTESPANITTTTSFPIINETVSSNKTESPVNATTTTPSPVRGSVIADSTPSNKTEGSVNVTTTTSSPLGQNKTKVTPDSQKQGRDYFAGNSPYGLPYPYPYPSENGYNPFPFYVPARLGGETGPGNTATSCAYAYPNRRYTCYGLGRR